MILAIDTSSARSGLALIEGQAVVVESSAESGRTFDVGAAAAALLADRAAPKDLEAVAIALGPGSFTGVRAGISFGVGLAKGLQVPLLTLGTLDVVAARAVERVTALSEAGRGRVYYLAPDGRSGIAEAAELPSEWPLAGWVRPATADLLVAAGHRLLAESQLQTFGEAVSGLLGTAPKVAYDRVKVEYMSSFGGLA